MLKRFWFWMARKFFTFQIPWWYILVLVFSVSLYLNSLEADFAYDDNRAIVDNQDLSPETPWYKLLMNDYWGTPIDSSNSHGSYRPLAVASFRINYFFHGYTPYGFHLVNLSLHASVTLLYTIFMDNLLNHRKRITLIASLLFASHPVHVESVTSIVGRADVGAALFYLLALCFYIRFVQQTSNANLYCSLISAMLSMLTKEHGITCLMVCAFYHLFIIHRFYPFSKECWRKLFHKKELSSLRRGLLHLIVTFIILIMFRISLMKHTPTFAKADNPASNHQSVIVRFLTFHYLPVFNFWLLIYPRWLSFDWSMDAIPLILTLFDLRNIFTLIFYAIIFEFSRRILNYYALISSSKNSSRSPINQTNNNQQSAICHVCHGPTRQSSSSSSMIFDENNNDNVYVSGYNHGIGLPADLNNNDNSINNQYSIENNNPSSINNNKSKNLKLFRKKKSSGINHHRLTMLDCLAMSLALMILPFLPATNLFFYIGFVIAERILYIPSFGFCLFIAVCIEKLIRTTKKFFALKYLIYLSYFILIITFSLRTILRNFDWLNEENLYRSGISINPPKAYCNLANVLSLNGRETEAEEAYKKALEHRFNMADAHYNLGLLYQNQKRYEEALVSYQLAIRFRPSLAIAHLNMGIILTRMGEKNRAKLIYEKCAKLDNFGLKDLKNHEIARISALYNLGRLYFDEDDYDGALKIFHQAVSQLTPHYPAHSLFNMIGEVYYKLNQTGNAEIWFNRSLKSKKDHIPAHLAYAKMLSNLKRFDEASRIYEKAIVLHPDDIAVYHHYGRFLMDDLGQRARALEIYQRGYRKFPDDPDIVVNLAHALRELKRNEEAEEFYKLAAHLNPNDVITHSNLGAIYHLNGKLELAKKSYRRALELKPGDNITTINLDKLEQLIKNRKQ